MFPTNFFNRIDTDLYKLTMASVFINENLHDKPAVGQQKIRNNVPIGHLETKILDAIGEWAYSTINSDQAEYLSTLGIHPQKLEILKKPIDLHGLVFKTDHYEFETNLDTASEIEIPLMHICSEVRTRYILGSDYEKVKSLMLKNNERKIKEFKEKLNQILDRDPEFKYTLMEFGTRRRFSKEYQSQVIDMLKAELPSNIFAHTSNLQFAMEKSLTATGTHAHEFQQVFQVKYGFRNSIAEAVKAWRRYYGSRYDTVLTDTLGYEEYLCQMIEHNLLSLITGERHDSDCPFQWASRIKYVHEQQNIDSKKRKLVFTDSLTLDSSLDIALEVSNWTNPVFGIGTALTNNSKCFEVKYEEFDIEAMQQVYKIVFFDGCPVVKLSDNFDKSQGGTKEAVEFAKQIVRK